MKIDVQRVQQLDALSDEENLHHIEALRRQYGKQICLLAHLYQRKTIADIADFVGDSYGLSRSAANFEGGKYIVFCGVRFMAESAKILCRKDQVVLHPDPEAGCPMADMASLEEVTRAWNQLSTICPKPIIPITYMNSTADIKAFCGKNEGTICTSSNATKTFEWAYQKSDQIFFLPDEHLGRNTALKYGLKLSDIAVWDPEKENGGESPERYRTAKAILWKGYCPVHQKFTRRDIDHVRRYYPEARVVVHPEVPKEVAEAADAVGSTDFIRRYVGEKTKPGDVIFIGTEINLVQNLAKQYPDRKIDKVHRSLCLTMYQITLARIRYALENLETFERVEIPESIQHYSRVALERMLSIGIR